MRWWRWLPFGSVPEVAPDELARQLDGATPPLVIDVRTTGEYRQGHIAGALHVPLHELHEAVATLTLHPDRPVIAICKTAHRSIPAVRLLRQRGCPAYQLAGGMDRWRRLGLPVVQGGPT